MATKIDYPSSEQLQTPKENIDTRWLIKSPSSPGRGRTIMGGLSHVVRNILWHFLSRPRGRWIDGMFVRLSKCVQFYFPWLEYNFEHIYRNSSHGGGKEYLWFLETSVGTSDQVATT